MILAHSLEYHPIQTSCDPQAWKSIITHAHNVLGWYVLLYALPVTLELKPVCATEAFK